MTQEEIISCLLELKQKIDKIEKVGKAKTTADVEIDPRYTTDIKTRSIMASASVLDKFDKFSKTKMAHYRKQDLFTLALLEFMSNHK